MKRNKKKQNMATSDKAFVSLRLTDRGIPPVRLYDASLRREISALRTPLLRASDVLASTDILNGVWSTFYFANSFPAFCQARIKCSHILSD
jgi:hypothetical protein